MTKQVLAISGKRFSGKDTLADMLVGFAKARGVAIVVHRFADESKRMLVAREVLRGVEVDFMRLKTDRAYKEHWRPRLTELTVTELARDKLVFCKAVADRIADNDVAFHIVADLRLRLEVEHLRERFKVHVVRVSRNDAEREAAGWRFAEEIDRHHTETELDDPALHSEVVENNASLDALAAAAETMSRRLFPSPP